MVLISLSCAVKVVINSSITQNLMQRIADKGINKLLPKQKLKIQMTAKAKTRIPSRKTKPKVKKLLVP